jgi:virginiamycin A acetyltransferase
MAGIMIKLIFKRAFFCIGIILSLPFIAVTLLEALLFGEKQERVLSWCKEILCIVPTIIGEYMRLGYYWAVCKEISPDALLMFGSMVAHRDTTIREGAVIGVYTIVGYADIGVNVLTGAGVSLISGKYQHGRPEERAGGQAVAEQYDKIKIGDNSWIGQNAIIMANVGENCTIAAGSVVYKDVPANSTYMGNPARKVNIEPGPAAKDG